MKDIEAFKIIVWHNDDVNGVHQRILCRAASAEKVLTEFMEYLQRPEWMRSFTEKNRVQLHGPHGLMAELPAIA